MARHLKGRSLLLLVLLLGVLRTPSACAQRFYPRFLLVEGSRFTLSAYYAQWQNSLPFPLTISSISGVPDLHVVTRKVRLQLDSPASPLFEGSYALNRHWSVGFWYNPIRGERFHGSLRLAPDSTVQLNLQRDLDVTDLHLVYTGPHGLWGQLGYYRERGAATARNPRISLVAHFVYTLDSWNLWVGKQFEVRVDAYPITPFLSIGYHPESDLEHAVSLLVGAAVAFNKRLGLSSSVWLFDLSHSATRITAGLVYQL